VLLAAERPVNGRERGDNTLQIECFDHAGAYAFADTTKAERMAVLQ